MGDIAKFECSDCDQKFEYKSAMIKHHEREHQKLNLPCEICGKVFKTRPCLKKHLTVMHGKVAGDRRDPFQCNSCNRSFRLERKLNEHKSHCSGGDFWNASKKKKSNACMRPARSQILPEENHF